MNVAQLIAALSDLPPDLPVVAQQGFMQDLTEVTDVVVRHDERAAWTAKTEYIVGPFVELQ